MSHQENNLDFLAQFSQLEKPDDLTDHEKIVLEEIQTIHDQEDSDTLPNDARDVLVELMKNGTILQNQKRHMFELLCRYEKRIRQHLDEVYLRLILDKKEGVALIANIEDDDAKKLINARPMTLYDTMIVLVLRKYYQDRQAAGDSRVMIDLERVLDYIRSFMPVIEHESNELKKLSGRMDEFSRRKLVNKIDKDGLRYEITPIISYVVNVEFLESMWAEFQKLASEAQNDDDSDRML